MKANEFKETIRKIVIEEVKREVSSQLPKLLPKLLFEMLGHQPKPVVSEQSVPRRSVPQTPPVAATPRVPQKPKQYVKNPILNQILNETTPGLPQTPYGNTGVPLPDFDKVGVSEEFKMEMKDILNEGSNFDFDPQMQPQMNLEPEVQAEESSVDISRLFNKNFKAIVERSKEKGTGGGNFSGVIQNW